MYNLDYIILKHSDTNVYKLIKYILLSGYFPQNLFYIFSVGVDQNLVFGQKQFVPKGEQIIGIC